MREGQSATSLKIEFIKKKSQQKIIKPTVHDEVGSEASFIGLEVR